MKRSSGLQMSTSTLTYALQLILPMLKTHGSHHRPYPHHYVRDFLNLLAVTQRVGNYLPFSDAADAALQ